MKYLKLSSSYSIVNETGLTYIFVVLYLVWACKQIHWFPLVCA